MLPVAFGVCLGNTSKVNARYCFGVVLGQVTIAHRASVGGGELLLILNLLFSSLLAKTRESRVEGNNIVLLLIRPRSDQLSKIVDQDEGCCLGTIRHAATSLYLNSLGSVVKGNCHTVFHHIFHEDELEDGGLSNPRQIFLRSH